MSPQCKCPSCGGTETENGRTSIMYEKYKPSDYNPCGDEVEAELQFFTDKQRNWSWGSPVTVVRCKSCGLLNFYAEEM